MRISDWSSDVSLPISSRGQERAGARKVGGSIDAERNGVNERHVDAQAGFERAELLEPLAAFEPRRRQRDEARQRLPAIGVEPDLVVKRPVPRRHGGAGEIGRASCREREWQYV